MKPRVLIVEDDQAAREGLVQVLQHEGYKAIPAADGAEALAYLRKGGSADVILLDLLMPDVDGWTFRRAQLRDPWLADIPVIALSVVEGRPLRGLQAAETLQKPVDVAELVRAVHAACGRVPR